MIFLLLALFVLGYRRYVAITAETLVLATAGVTALLNSIFQAWMPGAVGFAISLIISAVALAVLSYKKED